MDKSQKSISVLLAYLLFFYPILFSINLIYLGLFDKITIIDTIILYGILLVLFINYFFVQKNGINFAKIIFLFFFFFAFLFTAMFFPENIKYLWTSASDIENPLYVFLFLTLPIAFVAMNITDVDLLLTILEKWSIAITFLYFLHYIIVVVKDLKEPQYMVFSYNMLFSSVFLFILALNESRTYRWVLSILGLILIFITGARGAIVSGLASILIYYLFFIKKSLKIQFTVLILGATIIPLLFIKFNNILLWISDILDTIGIESRTINAILAESFFYESGRDSIRATLYNVLNLFGHGMAGERVVTGGSYSHNLFLSLICDFGIIIGAGIGVFIVFLIIKALMHAPDKTKILLCALLSTGFFRLMFSGSYLKPESALYMLLGLCLNENIYKQIKPR